MGLEIKRLNWAGLGVVEVDGRERCVPVTRQGERVEVRWHEAGWGSLYWRETGLNRSV